MLNRHFLKRLFYFVLIIALGASITIAVNYFENKKNEGGIEQVDSF